MEIRWEFFLFWIYFVPSLSAQTEGSNLVNILFWNQIVIIVRLCAIIRPTVREVAPQGVPGLHFPAVAPIPAAMCPNS